MKNLACAYASIIAGTVVEAFAKRWLSPFAVSPKLAHPANNGQRKHSGGITYFTNKYDFHFSK